jgi:hypothetical protein
MGAHSSTSGEVSCSATGNLMPSGAYDYSDQCWTLQEIEDEIKIDGLGFFDLAPTTT